MRLQLQAVVVELSFASRFIFIRVGSREVYWHPEDGLVRGRIR